MYKFHIHTYGCQMNVRDSQVLTNRLIAAGYEHTDIEDEADIVIVNSCSVRGKAEDKAIGKLGLLCTVGRREKPNRIVGLMGCMAQNFKETIFKRLPTLSFSVGTRCEQLIPAIVERALKGEQRICELSNLDHELPKVVPECFAGAEQPVSAFATILLGCNRRCAYCIVPDVRGPEFSRQPQEILPEIIALVNAGIKDITLLGQSVMNYGRIGFTWPEEITSERGFTEPLPRLFEYIIKNVPELKRIRFTSSHPSGVTDELVRALKEFPQLCHHVHLPMQSGSDRILKHMRRGYDSEKYLAAIKKLREALPDISITTDIIVGYPEETEEDFEATRRIMEEANFDNSFIFKYSPRPGTPSSLLEDVVTDAEKQRRNQVLLADQDVRAMRINNQLIGTTTEVLVEGPSLRNQEKWSGRNSKNKIVIFEPKTEVAIGDFVNVRITSVQPQTLYGEVVI